MSLPPRRPRSRIADITLAVLFLTAITLPLLVKSLHLDVTSLAENRTRAPRPSLEWDREALAQYPSRFETYFKEAFGLRDQLIRWNSLAKVSLLGVSPTPKVVIGKR